MVGFMKYWGKRWTLEKADISLLKKCLFRFINTLNSHFQQILLSLCIILYIILKRYIFPSMYDFNF